MILLKENESKPLSFFFNFNEHTVEKNTAERSKKEQITQQRS